MAGARLPWHWETAQLGWAAARCDSRGFAAAWQVRQFASGRWCAVWQSAQSAPSGARVPVLEWQTRHEGTAAWR